MSKDKADENTMTHTNGEESHVIDAKKKDPYYIVSSYGPTTSNHHTSITIK